MQDRTTTWLLSVALAAVTGCSDLTTEAPGDGNAFDTALPGLTAGELAAFVRGDSEFERRFAPATGLGPIQGSCNAFSAAEIACINSI